MENFHNIKEISTDEWQPLDRSPESENLSSNLQASCESLTSSSPPSELLDTEMATHLEICPPPTQLDDDSAYSYLTQRNPCSVPTFDCCQGKPSIYSGIEEIPFLPGSSYWSDAPSSQPSPSMLEGRSWKDFVSLPELQSRPSACCGTTNVPMDEYSKKFREQFISVYNTTTPPVYSFSGAFSHEPDRIQIDFLSNDAIGDIGVTSVYHGEQNCYDHLETDVNVYHMPGIASLASFDQTQPYAFSTMPMWAHHHLSQQTHENHSGHAAHFGCSNFNAINGDDNPRFMENPLHCITERSSLAVAAEPPIVDSSKSCNGSFVDSKTLENNSLSIQTRREALLLDVQRRQFQQTVRGPAIKVSLGSVMEEQMQPRKEAGSWKPTVAQDDTFAKAASDEHKRERELQRNDGMVEMGPFSNTKHKRHSEDDQKDASPVKKSTSWSSPMASGGKSEPSILGNIPPKQSDQPSSVALNTNMKPRARQGNANDPQSVAARHRRERISERLKILQELVPNGSKVDLVTMLEKAINYVKFLQLQVKVLSSDEYWPTAQDKTPKVATRLIDETRTTLSSKDPRKSDSGKSATGSKEKADTDLGKASSGGDRKAVSNAVADDN